ncbi:MAG: hypothetical protein MI799_10230 [Desulfobacterales bacterium]|nr:hypothetical protein [Desulfobacterales bacterium]
MSRKSIILSAIVLMGLFFVAGWFSYDWILRFVIVRAGQHITAISLQDAFTHRLMMSLSLLSAGASIGFGTLLCGRFSSRFNYGRRLLILLLVSVVAVSGRTVVLVKKLAALANNFAALNVKILPKTSMRLSEVPLYEIGIFGSACVVVTAVILAIFFSNQKS